MKKSYILFFLIFILSEINIYSQLSHGGIPLSFNQPELKSINVYTTPDYDYLKILKEDNQKKDNSKPFLYGKNHEVNLSPSNSGNWSIAMNGEKIWQLRIKSKGAYAIGLIFNKYRLNSGVRMFVFSVNKKEVIGSFTAENNTTSSSFSTIPIPGDEIIVELNIPENQDFGQLNISGIIHDFKNAFGLKTGYGSSGSCNINVNCPEGVNWQNEKRSIVKYSYVGSFGAELCTGVLVNNTAYNSKPYLLTAGHCISSQSVANTAVFIFNYESASCIATGNPSYHSLSAATLLSTGGNLDFSLLELNTNPPPVYNVYYSGWNKTLTAAQNTVTIHHPQGDIKKISKDYNPPVTGDYGSGYLYNSHWNIIEWDEGTTEGGSSGSPLFDQNKRIVGNLTGGDASCSYNFNDYYSKFDLSWDYYAQPSKQLKIWLDPINSGVSLLDGYDPNVSVPGLDVGILQVKSPIDSYCSGNEIVPEVIIQNKGSIDLTSASLNYKLNDGSTTAQSWVGLLKPSETINFQFNSILVSEGVNNIKFFTSAPNGLADSNNQNDTLSSQYFGEKILEDVKIDGSKEICSESLKGDYRTEITGNYLWNVEGGIIDGADNLQSVSVIWNKWGEKLVKLHLSNLCNEIDAEDFKVEIIEQSLQLEINTGGNGATVCYSIEDCNGNEVFYECNLEPFKKYTKDLCMYKGCYNFRLYSESNGVTSYSLNNQLNDQIILEGTSVIGEINEQFTLNSSTKLSEFNVYPNPAQNEIIIEGNFIELYEDSKFAIFNLSGAMVLPYNSLIDRQIIEISKLPRGMYFIEINSVYGKFAKKFLKL